jgi:RNA polymerase sigma-70 factor (ECF subfamily)
MQKSWKLETSGGDSLHGTEWSRQQARLNTFESYRELLFSIAYRMLGSAADTEDMLQETFIRWQQTQSEVESPRAFLVTIISRLCIQQLESARAKREEYVGQWLPEPIFTGHFSDPSATSRMNESLSMAFLLLLEKLSPAERATFLLHEVFDYDYSEVAQILGRKEASCRQLLRRARQQITDGRTRFETSPAQHEKLLKEFMAASSSGDLAQLVTLLSQDVVLYSDGGGKARAALNPIFGADRVGRFFLGSLQKSTHANVMQMIQINGQPSLVYSLPDWRVGCAVSFELDDSRIRTIYVVTNPDKLRRLSKLA